MNWWRTQKQKHHILLIGPIKWSLEMSYYRNPWCRVKSSSNVRKASFWSCPGTNLFIIPSSPKDPELWTCLFYHLPFPISALTSQIHELNIVFDSSKLKIKKHQIVPLFCPLTLVRMFRFVVFDCSHVNPLPNQILLLIYFIVERFLKDLLHLLVLFQLWIWFRILSLFSRLFGKIVIIRTRENLVDFIVKFEKSLRKWKRFVQKRAKLRKLVPAKLVPLR